MSISYNRICHSPHPPGPSARGPTRGQEHHEGGEASSLLYDLEHGEFVDSQNCCRVASPDTQLTTQDEEVQDIPDVNYSSDAPALKTSFDDGVDEVLACCIGKPWFDDSFFWDAPREFAANADAASLFIIRRCIICIIMEAYLVISVRPLASISIR